MSFDEIFSVFSDVVFKAPSSQTTHWTYAMFSDSCQRSFSSSSFFPSFFLCFFLPHIFLHAHVYKTHIRVVLFWLKQIWETRPVSLIALLSLHRREIYFARQSTLIQFLVADWARNTNWLDKCQTNAKCRFFRTKKWEGQQGNLPLQTYSVLCLPEILKYIWVNLRCSIFEDVCWTGPTKSVCCLYDSLPINWFPWCSMADLQSVFATGA